MGYIVYIGFAVLALAMVMLEVFLKNKKINIIPFVLLLLSFFLLAILKSSNVGIDSAGYSATYANYRSTTFVEVFKTKNIEIGFYGLAYIFSGVLKVPEIVFNAFCFLIICVCLFFSFHKNQHKTAYLSIFLFVGFFCMSFSGVRQAISISLATLGFTILFDDNKNKGVSKYVIYYLLVILACLFHKTSIILAVVPVLMLIFIEEYAIPYFPVLILLFSPLLFGRLIIMISSNFDRTVEVFDARVSLTLIGETIFVLLFYLFYKTSLGGKLRKKMNIDDFEYASKDSNYLMLIYLSCLFVAFNTASTVITRLSMFFYLGAAYYLVKIEETIKNPKMKIVYLGAITLFLGLYFVYSTPTLGLVPYEFR